MRAPCLLLTVAVAGCATEPFFPQTVGDVLCARLDACDPDGLEADYGTLRACRDTVALSMDWFASEAAGLRCVYDGEVARACLDAVRALDCAELDVGAQLQACGAAYGCVVTP